MKGKAASSEVRFTVRLPGNYRHADVLRFHSRDTERVAEAVNGRELRKAIVLDGAPCLVEIGLKARSAACRLLIDEIPPPGGAPGKGDCASTATSTVLSAKPKGMRQLEAFKAMAARLLGVAVDPLLFESAMAEHPLLSTLIDSQAGLAIPMAATPFEALTWAITGQQINLAVAIHLRRRLILLAGVPHSSGLRCYPDAQAVAGLTETQLGEAKFSRAKAGTLKCVSQMVCNGELPLDSWLNDETPADKIREQLLAVPGIGPWTANYTLLRGYGFPDCSLHGDAAVKNALRQLLQQEGKVSNEQAEAWLTQFAPWRSWIAAHLWASRS